MKIKIGSVFNLDMIVIPRENIHRLCFRIAPFLIRELKIGNLLCLTSGLTYLKALNSAIPEITPKIKVSIRSITFSELLNSNFDNLNEFFCYSNTDKKNIPQGDLEYFIATRDNELVYCTTLGFARGGRLMIMGTRTLERFRGKHINSAVLVYLMRYLREAKKIDKVYISTNGTNLSMQRSILRAGFKIDIIFYDLSLLKGRIRPMRFLRGLFNKT